MSEEDTYTWNVYIHHIYGKIMYARMYTCHFGRTVPLPFSMNPDEVHEDSVFLLSPQPFLVLASSLHSLALSASPSKYIYVNMCTNKHTYENQRLYIYVRAVLCFLHPQKRKQWRERGGERERDLGRVDALGLWVKIERCGSMFG